MVQFLYVLNEPTELKNQSRTSSREVKGRSSAAVSLCKPQSKMPLTKALCVGQPRIERWAGGIECLDRPVQLGVGRRASRRVAELPILASYHDGADRAFCDFFVHW